MDVVLEGKFSIESLFDDPVFFSKSLSILDHLLNLCCSQTASIICDRDCFLSASSFLDSSHSEYTVLINLKCHFNLWYSSLSWWNACEVKLAKFMVIFDQRAFAFKNTDRDLSLLVLICSVRL